MMLFLRGLVWARGILIGWVLVRSVRVSIGPFAVVLAALGLIKTMEYLFARHREVCWAPDGNPEGASVELAGNLLAVQFGILLGFAIFASALPSAVITDLFQFQLKGVFVHKIPSFGPFQSSFTVALMSGLSVMCISFFLGAIYQEGGFPHGFLIFLSIAPSSAHSNPHRSVLSLSFMSIGFMTRQGSSSQRNPYCGLKEHHSIKNLGSPCLLIRLFSPSFLVGARDHCAKTGGEKGLDKWGWNGRKGDPKGTCYGMKNGVPR